MLIRKNVNRKTGKQNNDFLSQGKFHFISCNVLNQKEAVKL